MLSVFFRYVLPVAIGALLQRSGPYRSVKMEITRVYLRSLQAFRFLILSLVGLGFLYLFTAAGLVFLYMGLHQVLAPDPLMGAVILISLSAVFLALCLAGFLWMFSEKRWMQQMGAVDLMNQSLKELDLQKAREFRGGRRRADSSQDERFDRRAA